MNKRTIAILPKLEKILAEFGENIKLARLRRKLTAEQICERAGIGRNTLWMIEKGAPSVAMGAYAQVLFTLGMENVSVVKKAMRDWRKTAKRLNIPNTEQDLMAQAFEKYDN